MIWWMLALTAWSLFLAGVAWRLLLPQILLWRDEPREPRQERRQRLSDAYAGLALDVADLYPRRAAACARRAYRLDPERHEALLAQGEVHLCQDRLTEAQEWFLRALKQVRAGEGLALQVALASYGVARSLAEKAAREPESEKREGYEAEARTWLRKALDHAPALVNAAPCEPAFRSMRIQVQSAVDEALDQEGFFAR